MGRGQLSRPLLDGIDLQVEMPALGAETLQASSHRDGSASIRARVLRARERQRARLADGGVALEIL